MTEYHLSTPLKEEDIDKLKINDKVYLTGTIMTARDKAHQYLLEEDINLPANIIYHCGPIVKKNDNYGVIAAGPTTSFRMSLFEPDIIPKYGIKAIIGKGGMDEKTSKALQKYKCVYLSALGGAAVLLAKSIVKVKGVLKLKEFGVPEAIWILEVKDFPTIVTMDSRGGNLHEEILKKSKEKVKNLI